MDASAGRIVELFVTAFVYMAFLLFVIVPIIHILLGIFLNKFNKLVYGEGSILAWFPIFNLYLLGKLTVNKYVGWILGIFIFYLIKGTKVK